MRAASLLIACTALGACAGDAVLLHDVAPLLRQCSRAVPAPADAPWRPSREDLDRMDEALDVLLEGQGRRRSDYGRQYAGYRRAGRPFIYANLFPLDDGAGPSGRRPRIVCDGGPDYFGVEFDVTREAVVHVAFNSF